MSQPWYCLYLETTESETVALALRALLEGEGYRPYDPFPGGTGTPPGLREMVRQFVAPAQDGWVRVLGQPAESVLPDLSQQTGPVLYGWLTAEDGGFALFQDGARHDDSAAFESFLHPDRSPDVLTGAFAGDLPMSVLESDGPPIVVAGAGDLPPELQQLAEDQGVDPRRAGKLVSRLGGGVFGRLAKRSGASADEQQQARALFMGGGRDDWNSLYGQRVRAVASVLRLPANWRVPDWQAVRDAYQVHQLRQRSPRMALMPGDKEAMAAVPDALSYLPVYMGKK